MSDVSAEPHIAAAVEEIIDGNNHAEGDYVIVVSPSVQDGGIIYTWKWFWSPKAPTHHGSV